MMRIAILGAGGAGKSWLAGELGRRLSIAPVHLDALYYDAAWRPIPAQEWTQIQQKLVKPERWIMDGNYQSTAQIRLRAADTIIFLDTPTHRRLLRLVARRLRRTGPARPDVVGSERLNWQFLRYVATFNGLRRQQMLDTFEAHAHHATVAILRRKADIDALLDQASSPVTSV